MSERNGMVISGEAYYVMIDHIPVFEFPNNVERLLNNAILSRPLYKLVCPETRSRVNTKTENQLRARE